MHKVLQEATEQYRKHQFDHLFNQFNAVEQTDPDPHVGSAAKLQRSCNNSKKLQTSQCTVYHLFGKTSFHYHDSVAQRLQSSYMTTSCKAHQIYEIDSLLIVGCCGVKHFVNGISDLAKCTLFVIHCTCFCYIIM